MTQKRRSWCDGDGVGVLQARMEAKLYKAAQYDDWQARCTRLIDAVHACVVTIGKPYTKPHNHRSYAASVLSSHCVLIPSVFINHNPLGQPSHISIHTSKYTAHTFHAPIFCAWYHAATLDSTSYTGPATSPGERCRPQRRLRKRPGSCFSC